MAERKAKAAERPKCGNGDRRENHYDFYNTLRNEFYDMDHEYRGKALIFSHDLYDKQLRLKQRGGNDKDWQRLEKCLKQLSFSVDVFSNLKYKEIMKQIEQTAKMDHSKNDCLLVVVLTHGESHAFLYARDTHYGAEKLWCRFTDENCPTLAGKPKLLIIQACQGENFDEGITLTRNYTEADGWFEPHKVPFHRDFLLALSTVPGYFSWRNKDFGSWFIQELCEELEYFATETDILTLLTSVSRNVALKCESYNPDVPFFSNKKAVPYFSSSLTRRLVFTKKTESSISHEEMQESRSAATQADSISSISNNEKSLFDYFSACFGF